MRNKLSHSKQPTGNLLKLLLLFLLTFGIQILTLVKATVVASLFGTSEPMDAYNFANSIVVFIFGIVTAGVSTIIIPEYSNKRKRSAVDTFITTVYGSILIIAVLLILFRHPVIGLFSNRGESFVATAAEILIILLLSQSMAVFSGVATAFFQCENKHNVPKLIALLCHTAVIVTIMVLGSRMNIFGYALIISCGNALCFLLEAFFAVKSGWRYKPTLLFDSESTLLFKRFAPIVFSGGIYQFSLLIDSMIASHLSTGMITILGYATQISSMVSTIVVGNLLLYIYPKITRNVQTKGHQDLFWDQSQGLHAIICLMIAGFICVGKEAVFLLLNRGQFSAETCETVFFAAAIYIFGQGTSIIRDMIYRYFYALGNTKIPAQNSVLVSVFNIVLSLLLVKLVGFYGIVLGTVVASVISLCIILFRFRKAVGFSKRLARIIGSFLGNFAVLAITVVTVYLSKLLLPIENNLLSILIFGTETVIIYTAIQYLFNRKVIKIIKAL